MPSAFRLAYLALATASLEEALGYYGDVIGGSVVERAGGSAYLSLGLDHHNISLRHAERPAIEAIGLQVGGDVLLPDLERRLRGLGFDVRPQTDARPGVPALLEVDVGGHRFHLLSEMGIQAPGFSGRGIEPLRLGHVAVLTTDAPAVLRMLIEGLGFRKTDWFTDGQQDLVTFVTCNQDHHVLNVIQAPFATLHHIAFQLDGRDHQFRAADLLTRHAIPTLWGPARHTAGHNVASYHHGADNALIELYNDMDVYVRELDLCEPRPWHTDLPQRPKRWHISQLTGWETKYEFDLATAALGAPPAP